MKLLIRGRLDIDYKMQDPSEMYLEAQQLMEDELIDYCKVEYMPFPMITYNATKHDYSKLFDVEEIPEEDRQTIRVKGILGTLKPDDFAVRTRIAEFMEKWKITSMFLCWSRAEMDGTFNMDREKGEEQLEL